MGHANATLTASWKINRYQVTVKPNGGIWGGTSTDSSFMLQYQEKKSIPDPTRKGYTFTRWSVSGAGSSLTGGVFTMGHADAAVAAQWRANTYSIAFDGNGETEGEMAPLAATVDSPIQLPQNLYKRTLPQGDSLFLGWSKDPASREAEYTDQQTFTENLAYEQDAVVTLYAIWDPNHSSLKVNPNGPRQVFQPPVGNRREDNGRGTFTDGKRIGPGGCYAAAQNQRPA